MYSVKEIIKRVNKEFTGYLMLSEEILNLSPKTNILQDLALDSFDHVELVMVVEEEFGIEISDEEASHCNTMQDVYKLVADKLGVKYTTFRDHLKESKKIVDNCPDYKKEKNMTTLKREDFINTKWDVSGWTEEMKIRWQKKMFDLGFEWHFFGNGSSEIKNLHKSYYFIENRGSIFPGETKDFYHEFSAATAYYEDVFPEEDPQKVSAAAGSGVHVESGSANDTRKNVLDNTSALDTLRNMCQEHGLYMNFDPHGEVIVTGANSDVEYKVENEDQLQKLLSALEVLNSYVK